MVTSFCANGYIAGHLKGNFCLSAIFAHIEEKPFWWLPGRKRSPGSKERRNMDRTAGDRHASGLCGKITHT